MADSPGTRRSRTAPTAPADTAGRTHLARLAAEVTQHGVWARVIDDATPYLRVSNPDSEYAVEDVFCEPRGREHAFVASFGVYLGNSGGIEPAARRIAWLVGATAG
ncbi:hypothetical protein GCM10027570_21700 [Streptomonospora sediminis]